MQPDLRGWHFRQGQRHRHSLVQLRTALRCQVHAVLAKCGVEVPVSDLFGAAGSQLLAGAGLRPPYSARVDALRRLIEAIDFEITVADHLIHQRLHKDPGYLAIQAIPGVGPVLAPCSPRKSATYTGSPTPDSCAAGPA